MAELAGYEILAKCLKAQGVKDLFYIMGGPMLDAESTCIKEGIRAIDTRHEQGAAYMAQAYSRVTQGPGVCMAASGPATLNLGTGLANALIDCCPVIAFGGSSPISQFGRQVFQEIDQVAALKACVKYADRVHNLKRIPQQVNFAFQKALNGKPGPVYLDFPSDVLYGEVEESEVKWPDLTKTLVRSKPQGDPALIEEAIKLLARSSRPVILSGSGVLWSDGTDALRQWVETTGMPIYTTPQGRGIIPEDHTHAFLNARSTAMKEADLFLVVGTRLNYVFGHLKPPRMSGTAKVVRIDIDPAEIGSSPRVDVGIVGDAGTVMRQLLAAGGKRVDAGRFADWRGQLTAVEEAKRPEAEKAMSTDKLPIHPLRLCKEVRDFIDRDAILVVDGQEILNYGRQSIPTYLPRHRINSGTFGTMGVGMPMGVGAKAAFPDKQVVVLHGDGSFGLNAMELDTAARHKLPVIVVISLNGGWTADPKREKPGRDLGYTRFDLFAQSLGCHGEQVEKPEDIRPALERAKAAIKNGKPALVNVVTDFAARAVTVRFTKTAT